MKVSFKRKTCSVSKREDGGVLFMTNRKGNVYILELNDLNRLNNKCLASVVNESWLQHRRLRHASMNQLFKLSENELVKCLPKIEFVKNTICEACQARKQTRVSFKSKEQSPQLYNLSCFILTCLGQCLHQALEKNYCFVVVDDFPRYTWTLFLKNKNDTFESFVNLARKFQNQRGLNIVAIRSDHGNEFENRSFQSYCEDHRISHNFSSPRTPQQNGVLEFES